MKTRGCLYYYYSKRFTAVLTYNLYVWGFGARIFVGSSSSIDVYIGPVYVEVSVLFGGV